MCCLLCLLCCFFLSVVDCLCVVIVRVVLRDFVLKLSSLVFWFVFVLIVCLCLSMCCYRLFCSSCVCC